MQEAGWSAPGFPRARTRLGHGVLGSLYVFGLEMPQRKVMLQQHHQDCQQLLIQDLLLLLLGLLCWCQQKLSCCQLMLSGAHLCKTPISINLCVAWK